VIIIPPPFHSTLDLLAFAPFSTIHLGLGRPWWGSPSRAAAIHWVFFFCELNNFPLGRNESIGGDNICVVIWILKVASLLLLLLLLLLLEWQVKCVRFSFSRDYMHIEVERT
jgi:hypothetical protein